jgi:Zn-dependent protease
VVLAIFNLFPVLPLDGGRIVTSLLPNRLAYSYSRLEPYGMPILIGLIVLMVVYRPLGQAFSALLNGGENVFYSLFGLGSQ